MAKITNIHDQEIRTRLRAEQADPWQMHIVVRKGSALALGTLAEQMIQTMRLGARLWSQPDSPHAAAYAAWMSGSFRKICVRARNAQWEQIIGELDHAMLPGGDVLVLPPRLASQREQILGKLQGHWSAPVQSLDVFDEALAADEQMLFIANEQLGMSAGKLFAQLGHGALMTGSLDERPCRVVRANVELWDEIPTRNDVIAVRDGGLTEIDPGSETVYVIV